MKTLVETPSWFIPSGPLRHGVPQVIPTASRHGLSAKPFWANFRIPSFRGCYLLGNFRSWFYLKYPQVSSGTAVCLGLFWKFSLHCRCGLREDSLPFGAPNTASARGPDPIPPLIQRRETPRAAANQGMTERLKSVEEKRQLIPSGKRLHKRTGQSPCYSWVNQRTQWHFSMSQTVSHYQRVSYH